MVEVPPALASSEVERLNLSGCLWISVQKEQRRRPNRNIFPLQKENLFLKGDFVLKNKFHLKIGNIYKFTNLLSSEVFINAP